MIRPWSLILLFVLAMVFLGCSSGKGGDDDVADDDTADDDSQTDDDTGGDDDIAVDDDSADDDSADDDTDDSMPWLHAENGDQPIIADDRGHQVLLRGVNFNHLGDYFETDPSLPTVAQLGADDWDDAAALGHNVIRLVTSWSAWQPERGVLDEDYLAKVRAAVAEANARGMYVVIDMHQDAWSKFVFTPVDEVCPEGTTHQKGWDGAPLWATFTDDQQTCTPSGREDSPAVMRAWENFYANREGVRDELVELWRQLATEFAFDAGVAGFDLLNEPGFGENLVQSFEGMTQFTRDAVAAVREAEESHDAPGHIIFFEQGVRGMPVGLDLGSDNLVFAPHNYGESIGPSFDGLLEFFFLYYNVTSKLHGTPLWIGEYNKFSDQASNDAWMTEYAGLEDHWLQDGGTWWQWEQECGDPHNAMYPPTPEWIEEQQKICGNARFEIRACTNRSYPRAVPGRLTSLAAVPCDGHLSLAGSTALAGVADLWIPGQADTEPVVSGTGVGAIDAVKVDGGWRLYVSVDGDYTIEVAAEAR